MNHIDVMADIMKNFHFELIPFVIICIISVLSMCVLISLTKFWQLKKARILCLIINIACGCAVASGMMFEGVLADNGADLGLNFIYMMVMTGIIICIVFVEIVFLMKMKRGSFR